MRAVIGLAHVLALAAVLTLAAPAAAQTNPLGPQPPRNPLGAPAASPWAGTWTDGAVTLTLEPRAAGLGGTLATQGQTYPVEAAPRPDGTLGGGFAVDGHRFELTARRDGDVLVLESGGATYRLKRPAAPANPLGGGSTPPAGGPTPPAGEAGAPAVAGADLAYVKVGQAYVYQLLGGVEQTWTVTKVEPGHVVFQVATRLNGAPMGEPEEQEWRADEGFGELDPAELQQAIRGRERVVVSGVAFDCVVFGTEDSRSWIPVAGDAPVFPAVIRILQAAPPGGGAPGAPAGEAVMTLVRIDPPR